MGSFARKRVLVAMSGGVDSTLAAFLLKRRGFQVEGVHMVNWDTLEESSQCTSDTDFSLVQSVCSKLKIPCHKVNFIKEYWNEVFSDMLEQYQLGFTPNPDILCNERIKFRALLRYVHYSGADYMATGHYARLSCNKDGKVQLLQAVDKNKDQTYFLSRLSQSQLVSALFPIGDMRKSEVRALVRELGFTKVAERPESMGLCFVGARKFSSFIEQYLPDRPGEFVNLINGQVEGTHKGVHMFTIGQRAALGGKTKPLYVAKKDVVENKIYVVEGSEHPALYSLKLYLTKPNWIAGAPPNKLTTSGFNCLVRFRHRQSLFPSDITEVSSDQLELVTQFPLYAATPGQHVVFYDEEECLGGALISKTGQCLLDLKKTLSNFDYFVN